MQIDAARAAKLKIVIERLLEGKTLAVAAVDAGMSAREIESLAKDLAKELSPTPRVAKTATKPGLALVAYADGGSRGNPGQAACGVVIADNAGNELLRQGKKIGKQTNNVAEYEGVLLALELCRELGAADVTLRLDSELVVRQIEGRYKVRNADLARLHTRALAATRHFKAFHVEHVPREQNKVADAIVNATLDGKDLPE